MRLRMVGMMGLLENTLRGLDGLARRRGRAAELPVHLAVGVAGEEAAFHFLRGKGYRVVARRWSSGELPGDLDLVTWREDVLCFVEVKTRTERDAKPAEAAIDAYKRATLLRLARRYVRLLKREAVPQVRFDVVSVYLRPGEPRAVEHFEGAIPWSDVR
ncbi:MAG TPA: YraN family protein [Terracidiphilus sp.]|nr:YraN family protein [Terracidiphilus sp.]